MTDPRGNRRGGFDPFELFDGRFWGEFEKQFNRGVSKLVNNVHLRKDVDVLSEATETEEAKTRKVLVATLDIPGVEKEDIKVAFEELDYGFTRLTIETKRGEEISQHKAEFRESVVADGAKAVAELGVLTIRVPLKEDDIRSKFDVPVA